VAPSTNPDGKSPPSKGDISPVDGEVSTTGIPSQGDGKDYLQNFSVVPAAWNLRTSGFTPLFGTPDEDSSAITSDQVLDDRAASGRNSPKEHRVDGVETPIIFERRRCVASHRIKGAPCPR